jgi:two-component system response regulator RegA
MRRVLVVENEADFAEALIYILREEGFEAVVARSIAAARTEAARFDPHVVLVDHLLDGETSDELVAEIAPARRVVLMSASSSSRRLAERHGLDFVAKPFDLADLLTLLA